MTFVVDASIVIGLLANRRSDDMLRRRLVAPRTVHAPQLIDAEVASAQCTSMHPNSPNVDAERVQVDSMHVHA